MSQIRFKKFWDLMNERDRPWHYDTILHLCTALSPYTCRTYSSVTAGTMQGILSQRAQVGAAGWGGAVQGAVGGWLLHTCSVAGRRTA